MRYCFLFFGFIYICASAHADDFERQLKDILYSIKKTEQYRAEIETKLNSVRQEHEKLQKEALNRRYSVAVNLHEYYTLQNSDNQYAFLNQDDNYLERQYKFKSQKNTADIASLQLEAAIQTLTKLHKTKSDIEGYLKERKHVEETLSVALNQLEQLKSSTQSNERIAFQTIIDDLQQHVLSLDDFLGQIINITPKPQKTNKNITYTLPVSGVIENKNNQLHIETRENALVTSPADGKIIYADDFKNLGKIIIIQHPDGHTSILRGFEKIYVNTGHEISLGDPIGLLHGEKNGENRHSSILIYELRYNNVLTNPILKITGL